MYLNVFNKFLLCGYTHIITKDIFFKCIDSTDILNKLAYESVDFTYKFKNKKASKVSFIIDELDIPLVGHLCSPKINDSLLTEIIMNKLPFVLENNIKNNHFKFLVVDTKIRQ